MERVAVPATAGSPASAPPTRWQPRFLHGPFRWLIKIILSRRLGHRGLQMRSRAMQAWEAAKPRRSTQKPQNAQ